MFEITEKNIEKLTYRDYASKDDGFRYELINGELQMSTAPSFYHQRLSVKLLKLLDDFVSDNSLGWVVDAPTDVILDDNNTLQPDILFISNENLSIIKEDAVYGAPDLIVEIISPSSVYKDRHTKKYLYEKFGVKEYWIVDIANKLIEVFENQDNSFSLFSYVSEKGKITSKILPGFEADILDILPDIKL